jgi:hypothetical protein
VTFEESSRHTVTMSRRPTIRESSSLLLMMLLCAGSVAGQSALSAAQPTAINSPAGTAKPEKRLEVVYADGKLTIDASNASLNQVLREISEKTGMRVSGSMPDEKVFGHYGPLSTSELLPSLLDGTESNMLLVDNKSGTSELILSARRNGASPPSSTAATPQNELPQEQQQQYVPPVRAFQPPVATGRGPVAANPDGSPSYGRPVFSQAPPADDTQKTPQQIYEQLQGLGSQQQAPPPE